MALSKPTADSQQTRSDTVAHSRQKQEKLRGWRKIVVAILHPGADRETGEGNLKDVKEIVMIDIVARIQGRQRQPDKSWAEMMAAKAFHNRRLTLMW